MDAAIFDWDGTLSDSRPALLASLYECSEAVLGWRYPSSADEEDIVFTRPGAEIWPAIASDAEQAAELFEAFQAAYARHSQSIKAFPGVADMLTAVRAAGISTAVVTSKGRLRYEPDAARIGLAHEIDVAVCAGEASPKPDPAGVLEALRRLGADPACAAMVGDTPVDIVAGVTDGVTAIGVAWGHSGGDLLRDAGAHVIAQTPAELTQLLLSTGAGSRASG